MAYAGDLCGSKLRSKLASTLNEASAQPISTNSFAAKQMEKMGWTEGTGLGKKRDGITTHIKVKKREETSGLGIEKEKIRKFGEEGMWWASSVGDTLMKLQKTKKKSKESKKDKKKKSKVKMDKPKIYSDEDLFKATGGARFGMRAQSRAEGKWKRTENSSELKEWENQLKDKIEWNGLGKAEIVYKESEKSGKRKRSEVDEGKESVEEICKKKVKSSKEKKSSKKKKKKSKKKEENSAD